MWCWEAAHRLMAYNVPNDHDGPRHFELGMSIAIAKLLRLTAHARGEKSADLLADKIIAEAQSWKQHRQADES